MVEKWKMKWKPQYPNKGMAWMYGSYSNFEQENMTQDNWNMNTHIGNRTISIDRIKMIESENGRTDALSIILEVYDKFREKLKDIDLNQLDDFIEYAKERSQLDKDYASDALDIGRRSVNEEEEKKYQNINQITTQMLERALTEELSDTMLLDETQETIQQQEKQLEQEKEGKENTELSI